MRKLLLTLMLAMSCTYLVDTATEDRDSAANYLLHGAWVAEQRVFAKPLETAHWERIRYRLWLSLCLDYRTDVECQGIKAPKFALFNPSPWRPGLMGYYAGGDTVYIRRGLKINERENVLLHEMSHYLDVMTGMSEVPGEALDICFSEKRAWRVSDLHWLRLGYPEDDKRIVGETWTEWYTHCTPHKDTLYPKE